MPERYKFLMAGGGTGGHVIPLLAVARELKMRGHEVWFVGTSRGAEAKLAPQAGFELELIRVGGLLRVGALRQITSMLQLVQATLKQRSRFRARRPDAVFSLGGYVAGPPVLAALLRGIPIVAMEPNAAPGFTNAKVGRWVKRALVNFPETARYFPPGRTLVTGLPVREEFFQLPEPATEPFTVLITGGSQGSRTLNEAARAAWPKLGELGSAVYVIHQAGAAHYESLQPEFARSGVNGEISAFIADMPGAFARAHLIICRSGAGAVSELAAAAKPSVLIPFPFATGDHQLHNAEQFRAAGAAMLFRDAEWNGETMLNAIRDLNENRSRLAAMSAAAGSMAHRDAARQAANTLEEVARKKV